MLAMLFEMALSHAWWVLSADAAMSIASISWSSSRSAVAVKSMFTARVANWYRRTVSMLLSVSESRLTLLPFCCVGACDVVVVATAVPSPPCTDAARAFSNETTWAW